MIFIKATLKIIVLPAVLALSVIQLLGILASEIASFIFGTLAKICFLTALVSLLFQTSGRQECYKMMLVAGVIYMIPCAIGLIAVAAELLRDLINEYI